MHAVLYSLQGGIKQRNLFQTLFEPLAADGRVVGPVRNGLVLAGASFGRRNCIDLTDRERGDAVPPTRVLRVERESADFGVGVTKTDVLDNRGDDRLIAEVLSTDMAEYTDSP